MAVLLAAPYSEFLDNNDQPLAGGLVFTYAAGTTTPKATYTDASGSTPATNPIVLDAYGRAAIWINGTYKFDVRDSANVPVRSPVDNVGSYQISQATDYALNPWVPVLNFDTGSATYTANGYYTKIGNVVTISCRIACSAVSSPTGVMRITGLPFPNAMGTNQRVAGSAYVRGMDPSFTGAPVSYMDPGSSQIIVQEFTGGTTGNIGAKFTAASDMTISIIYLTTA